MKVTHTAVYKLVVQAECGCASTAEYTDAGYRSPVGETAFAPCTTHKDTELAAALGVILKEVVLKEAHDRQQAPQDARPERTNAAPAAEGTEVRRPLPGVARRTTVTAADRSATGPTGRPTLRAVAAGEAQAAPATPPKPGTETRTPLPGAGPRPTPGGTPRVVGGAAGVKRVDPNAALARRGLATAKTASAAAAAPMSMDIGEEVDEDSRVTNLIESSGVLDMDDDDEM